MILMISKNEPADEPDSQPEEAAQLSSKAADSKSKLPLELYTVKDAIERVTSHANFLDAVLIAIAFIAAATALPFYPVLILPIILIALIALALFYPFLGLIVLMVVIFPAIAYQVPALALFFLFVVAASLIAGYLYYRSLAFLYILVGLAFSPLGLLLEIPAFIMAVLVLDYKRAIVVTVATFICIVALSAVTGTQNTGYIAYDASAAHSTFSPNTAILYGMIDKPVLSLSNFSAGMSTAMSHVTNSAVVGSLPTTMSMLLGSLSINTVDYIAMLAILIAAAWLISWIGGSGRSKFNGVIASLPGIAYPLSYAALSAISNQNYSIIIPFASFLIAPAFLYATQRLGIDVIKVQEVRKQDIRMKFGEAFESLGRGASSETFKDIGGYDATKKELHDAVLAPIEERGISKAYNVKPSRGILFFGPPGTGKTMIMRALANEMHGGFYVVKGSNLISAYPGETERMISEIFEVAAKHAPCVLFFDEIDAIALSRKSAADVGDVQSHALSQLLQEMDGFQKLNNVIIVGATNVPNLLDPAIMRPGRFDKIIYMPLPDVNARKRIFQIYLSKLPLSSDIDYERLAEKSERFSGADIKALCENVAQRVAQEASSERKVLEVTMKDLTNALLTTKPSTSIAQLEEYTRFRMDFERRSSGEDEVERGEKIKLGDVIGVSDAKKAIADAIEIPLLRPELLKKYDVKNVNGILLFGPPGTGKTMLMKAMISELTGINMIEVNGSVITQMAGDKAVATIKEIFNRAKENAPAVIIIDEIDGFFPRREGASEASIQRVSQILQEIDGVGKLSNVLIVGATNNPEALDPALLRPGRFDKLIFVKPPSAAQRAEMFEYYLMHVPKSNDIDFEKLGNQTKGFTGADISNICREAKTRAMEAEMRGSEESEDRIDMAMLERILKTAKPSAPEQVVSNYLTFLQKYGER
jgi:SpoVK/Ycf46/Vps4 family AAA+-type ATPase